MIKAGKLCQCSVCVCLCFKGIDSQMLFSVTVSYLVPDQCDFLSPAKHKDSDEYSELVAFHAIGECGLELLSIKDAKEYR